MSTITVVDLQGDSKEVELVEGLMCGGCCSCATCHVHISGPDLPPVEEDEEMLLLGAENYQSDKSRLSCQVQMQAPYAGMVVTLVELD